MESLDASSTMAEAPESPNREGRMSIFLIMPLLAATGIYNPQVMHHNRCIAEPGTVAALYCVQAPAAPPHHPHGKK
jgi:hypothetical protein